MVAELFTFSYYFLKFTFDVVAMYWMVSNFLK